MRYQRISYVVVAILLLCKSSTSIHHAFVLLQIVHIQRSDNNIIIQYKQSISTIPVSVCYSSGSSDQDQEDDILNNNNNNNSQPNEEKDTIRVRIWKALVSSNGTEISLTQLCKLINVRNKGDVRSHLIHVERQAKTIQNKSNEWRVRRGLIPIDNTDTDSQDGSAKGRVGGAKKLKIKRRRGAKNEEFIRLVC